MKYFYATEKSEIFFCLIEFHTRNALLLDSKKLAVEAMCIMMLNILNNILK